MVWQEQETMLELAAACCVHLCMLTTLIRVLKGSVLARPTPATPDSSEGSESKK
jgi:hypothetical protein